MENSLTLSSRLLESAPDVEAPHGFMNFVLENKQFVFKSCFLIWDWNFHSGHHVRSGIRREAVAAAMSLGMAPRSCRRKTSSDSATPRSLASITVARLVLSSSFLAVDGGPSIHQNPLRYQSGTDRPTPLAAF